MDREFRYTEEELRAFFEHLKALGVCFYTGCPDCGCLDLSPKTAIAFIADAEGFWCARLGVDRQTYRRWTRMRQDPFCTAITKRGARCRNPIQNYYCPADEFVPGYSDRCSVHAHTRSNAMAPDSY